MSEPWRDAILLDLFRTNQVRERLIAAAVEGLELPAEDYPFYVLIGAEGPLTPTALAARTEMPLSTVLFRAGRLERRGHAERNPNPEDRRSYLLRLTGEGQNLLREARPRFRAFAEAVETQLGNERVGGLRGDLSELRAAIEAQLGSGRGRAAHVDASLGCAHPLQVAKAVVDPGRPDRGTGEFSGAGEHCDLPDMR